MNLSDSAEAKILVVDDTEESIDILVDTLDEQYDISAAMDGATALRIISENPPDLILLDLSLPGMSGLEFLTYLRSNAWTNGIPVVVLTNASDPELIEELYSCGANSYIVKPVCYEDFVVKLAELTMYWSGTVEVPGGSPKVAQETAVLF